MTHGVNIAEVFPEKLASGGPRPSVPRFLAPAIYYFVSPDGRGPKRGAKVMLIQCSRVGSCSSGLLVEVCPAAAVTFDRVTLMIKRLSSETGSKHDAAAPACWGG